ncbi:phosphate signaling complex protein PhoU [Anaerorhabdus furcosa]|uniref:Phosphate-specific transport system accessory protein PhoU n=1 Tax=Anaerorhabdus furcosa TaxID=118967 RepID=A0A1T4NWR1_9FIRM|nr:phosphate signaling complex protein PhoU [Anaerorhabdus furcosa]SJZ83476.1 phosphate transport system protein [Anaerorhabdus furcosa]
MTKLDEKCSLIKECVMKMAKRVEDMYSISLEIMETGNTEAALKVIEMDSFVNSAEEEINDLAIEALCLLSPVASDLRKVITGIKIASDLERIGDYAKSIAGFVVRNGKLNSELASMAKDLGDAFLAMIDHAMDSYNKSDAVWAMSIPEEDAQIDKIYDEIVKYLQDKIRKQEMADDIIPILSMLRNLKRAGEHTKNICEHTIFEVKGQHIEFN